MFFLNKFLRLLVFLGITAGLPIYFILWVLFYSWYLFAVTLSKVFKKDLQYPVTGVSSFLTPDMTQEKPNAVLIHMTVLQGNPDPNTVVDHLQKLYDCRNEDGTRMYDKLGLSSERWLGYSFWKTIPNFKVKDYVHFISDRGTKSTDVNQFIEKIIRKPFESGSPLWEIFVLTSPTVNGDCYVVFRTHHILLDGMTILKLWYKADGGAELPPDLIKYSTSLQDEKEPLPAWRRCIHNLQMMIVAPYLSNRILCTPNDQNYLTNEYKDFDGDWYCSPVNKIHLEKYREPLRALNFTLTHAILVAYSRGFRNFMEKHYGSEEVPDAITIFGSVPRPNHPDHLLTNHWGIMRYQAGLNIHDLRDQLVQAKKEYTQQIQSNIPEMFEFMSGLMACLPGLVTEYGLQTEKSGTLAISNVPGPKTQQKMFNLPVTDRAMWLPLTRQNSGVGLLFLTYNGWGNFTMTADSGCIKDRGAFNDLHQMVLKELAFVLDEVVKMGKGQNGIHPDCLQEIKIV